MMETGAVAIYIASFKKKTLTIGELTQKRTITIGEPPKKEAHNHRGEKQLPSKIIYCYSVRHAVQTKSVSQGIAEKI